MTPRYFTWSCVNCEESLKNDDCVADGKYCALDEERLSYSGKEIIYENLRQKCIWKHDKDAWWDYLEAAHSQCYTDFTEDCSKSVHSQLGINWSLTNKCVEDSFDSANQDNSLLYEDSVEWTLRGPHYIPAVVINKIAYRGTLDPQNVFSAICESFRDPQPECKHTGVTHVVEREKVNFGWFLFAIFLIILINLVIICMCRRCSNRELKDNVNSAIVEYMSLRKSANDLPSDKE